MPVSISCEVSPQVREFERFNTVCANAYVKPLMGSYLGRLLERLKTDGADCPVYVIHSGGGIIDVDTAVRFPVRLIESGPAGGAIFATHIAARYGFDKVLSYDMGGTTAKICLIDEMRPKTAKTFEVARTYRFKKGSGMPISIPVIDMVEIGAGGGSIASVDAMRQIRVGPESAGSEPGPACYGRGGDKPTVSDADLVLGRLDPNNFAGGSITLDTAAAESAMSRDLGDPLGMDAAQAAYGLCEVVDENMANAARVHAVESGKDIGAYRHDRLWRRCPNPCGAAVPETRHRQVSGAAGCRRRFGHRLPAGALQFRGGPHRPHVNERLRCRAHQPHHRRTHRGGRRFRAQCDRRRRDGARMPGVHALPRTGLGNPGRYRTGQFRADRRRKALPHLFEKTYTRFFGRPIDGAEIELVSWAVKVSSPTPPVEQIAHLERGAAGAENGERHLFDIATERWSDAHTYERGRPQAGRRP